MADEYDIVKAIQKIEDELIASIIRNMRKHKVGEVDEDKQWTMWQVEQLKSLEKFKKQNQKKYGKVFKSINKRIEALIGIAKDEGEMEQEIEILNAIKKGFKGMKKTTAGLTAEFFKLNERKLEALIKATVDDMENAEMAILRRVDDQYRKIIYDAQVYANTGAGTYEKAVDMATKDFLASGIQCVEYANGARHTLSDYADMAIRTASKRAYLQGEGVKRQEWGITTVIMNKRGNPCPKCLPFCGKVLVDDVWSGGRSDGIDPETGKKYPTMSYAISQGLYHPRCLDSHTTYFPGISTADDTWTEKELEDIGLKAKQEAKQQYAKRQTEKFERLAKYSLDEENRRKYSARKRGWKKEYNSYKYPIHEDMFLTFINPRQDNKNIDMIKPHNIIKELKKTEVGEKAYLHIKENEIPVYLLYNTDNPNKLSGEYDPFERRIYIYADVTKTINETAKTVIHESMHDKLGHTGTRKEEVRCFIEELKHDGIELTYERIKNIIKAVNNSEVYKKLPWR